MLALCDDSLNKCATCCEGCRKRARSIRATQVMIFDVLFIFMNFQYVLKRNSLAIVWSLDMWGKINEV